MADQQDLPDDGPDPAPQSPDQPSAAGEAPAEQTPAKKAPAKKAPAKKAAAKKAPAKKAPAKKAPAKKAPAKQVGDQAPAKKAPAKKVAEPPQPTPVLPLTATNGSGSIADGAKQAAAQAKTTVEQASDTVRAPVPESDEPEGNSPMPYVVALVVTLLAVLWIRRLRQRNE